MSKRLTFAHVFCVWFILNLVVLGLNGAVLHSSLLVSAASASLGVFLLLVPVYPQAFKDLWDERKARIAIRILAALYLLLVFSVRVYF